MDVPVDRGSRPWIAGRISSQVPPPMSTNPSIEAHASIPGVAAPADDPQAYVGAIPEHYHRGVGAFLFEPYAQELAARAVAFAPVRVLETACGTGILTRRLVETLPG